MHIALRSLMEKETWRLFRYNWSHKAVREALNWTGTCSRNRQRKADSIDWGFCCFPIHSKTVMCYCHLLHHYIRSTAHETIILSMFNLFRLLDYYTLWGCLKATFCLYLPVSSSRVKLSTTSRRVINQKTEEFSSTAEGAKVLHRVSLLIAHPSGRAV
jgi:hypothetical protein